MKQLLLALGLLLLPGCLQLSPKKTYVTVDFSNVSPNALNWVKLVAGERQLSVGVLIPFEDATLLDTPWSKVPDQGKVTFIDDQTRKPYSVDVSLKEVNERVKSGQCKRVAIRILAYDRAEVVCK